LIPIAIQNLGKIAGCDGNFGKVQYIIDKWRIGFSEACAKVTLRNNPSRAQALQQQAIMLLINKTQSKAYPNWLPPAMSVAQFPGSI
jgi:hypothetical protein